MNGWDLTVEMMTTMDLRTSDTYAKNVDGAAISDRSAKWSALLR